MKQTSAKTGGVARRHPDDDRSGGSWLFLSNHLHLLASIARRPEATIRQLADSVGISERAAHQIMLDLERAGYLTRSRVGRRNHYQLHRELPLRHDLHRHRTIGQLLDFLNHGIPAD